MAPALCDAIARPAAKSRGRAMVDRKRYTEQLKYGDNREGNETSKIIQRQMGNVHLHKMMAPWFKENKMHACMEV